ncbi:hypothetical protein [uncultured Brevibacillus sp.]|uniref:hypothetical protein n=1 Tax=uncultured Brevibacillus sp. TaxID=169970 RepID=UPI002594C431|nr:hypothetical protein [uncultured Brevibacillus sp.]
MSWLQDGPFLELSFIFNEPTNIEKIISKLNNTNVKIEVHNSPEYIQQFFEGSSIAFTSISSIRTTNHSVPNQRTQSFFVPKSMLFPHIPNTKTIQNVSC